MAFKVCFCLLFAVTKLKRTVLLLGYVKKYATEVALRDAEQENAGSSSESSLSDFDEDETQDMEL